MLPVELEIIWQRSHDHRSAEHLLGPHHLVEVHQRLNDLLTKQNGTGSILITPEVEAEIETLRDEQIKTRGNLRMVRRNLEREVRALGTRIKLINIAAIPILVALSALGLAAARGKKRQAA